MNKNHKFERGAVDKFMLSIVGITILSLIAVVFFATRSSGATKEVVADEQVELSVSENNHDWGTIDYDGGIVSKSFDIKNTSGSVLKIYDVKTSCMCTTAQLKTSESESKKYGMHEKSSDVFEVKPDETAELLVEFDPAFHGPSGVGPITRTITMNTNDTKNPTLQFNLTGTVVKN